MLRGNTAQQGRSARHVPGEVLEETGAHEQRVDELVHCSVDEGLSRALLRGETAAEAVTWAEINVAYQRPPF